MGYTWLVIAHQYVALGHKDERCALDKVYWLEINKKETSDLWKEYTRWKPWLTRIRPDCREARDPWHCTIKYDEEGHDKEYGSLWEEQQEGQTYNVKVTNIIIGQQGIAAGVELPNRVEDWYQILEAALHITLMIGQGFESKDIRPMMREAGQLRDWVPTLNSKVEISKDRRYLKINITVVEQIGGVVSSSDIEKPSLQVEPGDYVYIRVFKRKHWKEPRREGPFKVVLTTPTAVKVKGKEYWYHLNHCCRAAEKVLKEKSPEPKETKSKLNADLDDSDSESAEQSTGGPAQNTRARRRASPQ
ncbi:hypothetical protein QTP70_021782 [Hemibagrus guttatus]|uniref:Murine leukemia virus integrase C-terminal domain-containing protein n=1 Tax=Hemibagrus guttatus TaxID=175788 RepID=A0AAE0Q1A0_9TELE|nr:hypothetical protein QTP70_021782 [Hemibagrus guttatus]